MANLFGSTTTFDLRLLRRLFPDLVCAEFRISADSVRAVGAHSLDPGVFGIGGSIISTSAVSVLVAEAATAFAC
jgi:hypothetical protein